MPGRGLTRRWPRSCAASKVSELCRRHDRYRLQIQTPADAFLENLRLEGVRILPDNGGGELRVAVPPGWVTRGFSAACRPMTRILRSCFTGSLKRTEIR